MQLKIQTLTRLSRSEVGASAVEYALLVIAIALVMVIGAFALGGALDTRFNGSAACVAGNSAATC